MARQNMYPSTWRKELEVYQNFGYGLNTKSANESLNERELPYIQNIDITERGQLEKRAGLSYVKNSPSAVGQAQGLFRYFKADKTYIDIVAMNGILYINSVPQAINGYTGSLQKTRPMNAVQHKGILYIATGTELVYFDGTYFSVLAPYKPKPLEALYVGLNGLANDPEDFITNGVSTVVKIEGVKTEEELQNPELAYGSPRWLKFARYATSNQILTFEAIYSKPEAMQLEFKFEKRLTTHKEDVWYMGRDWNTDSKYSHYPAWVGTMQLKISVREKGKTLVLDEYILPKYVIKTTKDLVDEGHYSPTMKECNQIFVYWGRLYMYGDPNEPDVIYASDIDNFGYFPITNTLRFENDKKEGIVTIARYRDQLIVFSRTSIQALQGKTPTEWTRVMVNSGIGCIAPKSVQAIENDLYFLSQEGIFRLKTPRFDESNMNVEKMDTNVDNYTMINDPLVSSTVYNGQYYISYPSTKRIMRFYYEQGVWTMDTSFYMDMLDFARGTDNTLQAIRKDGSIMKFDKTLYTDAGNPIETIIELKGFSLGVPYHVKKVREIRTMFGDQPLATNITLDVFVDDDLVHNETRSLTETIKDTTDPKETLTNILETKVNGKGHYVKTRLTHNGNGPLHFVGIGIIFKTKKP